MLATTTSPCALRGVHVRYSLLCVAASIYASWSIVGYHYIVSVRFVEYTFIYWSTLSSPSSGYRDRLLCLEEYIFGMLFPAYPSAFTPRPVPVSPLHLPVSFEEYIVGILFTLISAFLRRLHLPEHQADELTTAVDWCTATAEELLADEADELTMYAAPSSQHFYPAFIYRSTRLTILLPLRSCSLTKAVPLWNGSLNRPLPLRSCSLMMLTGLLQNPIPACVQTNLSWTSRLRFHSMSSL